MKIPVHRTRLFQIAVGVVCFGVTAFSFASSENCDSLKESLRTIKNARAELVKKQVELKQEFDLHVAEDYDTIGAGILDEIHRNAAIKARFASKQLDRQIAKLDKQITESAYCTRCLPHFESKSAPIDYCRWCTQVPVCRESATR